MNQSEVYLASNNDVIAHRFADTSANRQQSSPMPFFRYRRPTRIFPLPEVADRRWIKRDFEHAPIWASVDLRDGNQALPNPMGIERKLAMFRLLVDIGFKDIEIGYPSASEQDFSFVRTLIEGDLIPEDVRVGVFTPARPELIDETFRSLIGAPRATVHLCIATACLWRESVLGLTRDQLRGLVVTCAEQIGRRADAMPGSDLRFEFSPETFNMTEPDFALEMCNTVTATWNADRDRPVTLNLPTTVETHSPTVFADQIEWMHRNLDSRDSVVLSVHPHNDRGTAVASAELAVRAGADRVEGTLFGNGERTGNVCLATLALNLFSQGCDPQLDFSDIDAVRTVVEECNELPVHPRHPYAGELVYSAFSGTHQDAIAKGLDAQAERVAEVGSSRDATWYVPYLPVDPSDVGRNYEAVVRVNSQSGRKGIAHVLDTRFGFALPRAMQAEFAALVQSAAEDRAVELSAEAVLNLFTDEYLVVDGRGPSLLRCIVTARGAGYHVELVLVDDASRPLTLTGTGADRATATVDALRSGGWDVTPDAVEGGESRSTSDGWFAAVASVARDGRRVFGAGREKDPDTAVVSAILAATNRSER